MATTIKYTSDGTTRNLTVPFPYISKTHILVTVAGVEVTDFTWPTLSSILLAPEVPLVEGDEIAISRRTPTGVNPVTFKDGSVLGESDLNLIATYTSYVTEEAREFTDLAEAAALAAATSLTAVEGLESDAADSLEAVLLKQTEIEDAIAGHTAAAQAAEDAFDLHVATVTATVQAIADSAETFDPANYVPRAGNVTLTGPVEVPAGATGAQAIRAGETVKNTGDEAIAGIKTFTASPVVPAGATGSQTPRADDLFGRAQTWQTVTRTSGTTYTNSTGKPILIQVSGAQTTTGSYILLRLNGLIAQFSNLGTFATATIGASMVIPDGSTYAVELGTMTSVTVKEFRA